ncbi:MAG: hypothetical protein PHI15_04370 [Methanomicrobium sp.]|nr:hypothetical protein [Methanomicrobium sp.]
MSTLIIVYGMFISPAGWFWEVAVWIYALVMFIFRTLLRWAPFVFLTVLTGDRFKKNHLLLFSGKSGNPRKNREIVKFFLKSYLTYWMLLSQTEMPQFFEKQGSNSMII